METNGHREPRPTVDAQYVITRQGQRVVLYRGLLDLAHQLGLASIQTELIQVPGEDNGRVAIVKARATLADGRAFEGYGDAEPANVQPQMRTMLIRLAETRAKARALRDAVNIGDVAFEELAEEEPELSRRDALATSSVRTDYLAMRELAEKEGIEAPKRDVAASSEEELREEGRALRELWKTSRATGFGKLWAEALHAGLEWPRLRLGDDAVASAQGLRDHLDAAKAAPRGPAPTPRGPESVERPRTPKP